MSDLDLLTGIGKLIKALEGYVRPVTYCENDRYALGTLLLPKAPIWDDMRSLSSSMMGVPMEIIFGGFFCQGLRAEKRKAALAGIRGGLFFKFDILKLISKVRPHFVFLENIGGMTVRGAERVVGELCRLGYDLRWGVLSTVHDDAPYREDQWWLLGAIQRDRKIGKRKGIPGGHRQIKFMKGYGTQDGWWRSKFNVSRAVKKVPFRVTHLKALGNTIVPAQAREAFERLIGIKRDYG